MEKLVSYICGDVTMLKHDMAAVDKVLKRMNRQHILTGLCLGLCGGYIYLNEKEKKEDRTKLDSLTKEVEGLKKSKGE